MSKIIAREVAPEYTDFSFYFDGDVFRSIDGCDLGHAILVPGSRKIRGYNEDVYENITGSLEGLYYDMTCAGFGIRESVDRWLYWLGHHHEKLMRNTRRLGALSKWLVNDYGAEDSTENIAKFLSIVTGKDWDSRAFCGYSQGDYIEVVYCKDHYSEDAITEFGKLYLGCGSEFVIDDCHGFYIIDTVRWDEGPELVKTLAELSGYQPEDLEVHLYDGEVRTNKYRILEVAQT